MRKLRFINSRKEAQWAFLLTDGRMFEVMNKEGKLLFRYDTPINLTTGEIGEEPPFRVSASEEEQLAEGFTTMNRLKKEGRGDTVFCYDFYDINLGMPKTMTIRRTIKIAQEFKKHGFNVSSAAIMHNFEAWKAGWKVGYRDEQRGYHLFSPCGGNPLSLRATTLEECCTDWQQTYLC